MPMIMMPQGCVEMTVFCSWKTEAPKMTGMESKKENRAAFSLFHPKKSAPPMVKPEREKPGTMAIP